MVRNLVELTCREVVELVTEFLSGALPPDDTALFEQHLHACPACVGYLDQVKKTVRMTGTLREDELPPEAVRELVGLFRNWKKS